MNELMNLQMMIFPIRRTDYAHQIVFVSLNKIQSCRPFWVVVHSKGVHKPVGRQRRRAGRTYLPRPFLKDALCTRYLLTVTRPVYFQIATHQKKQRRRHFTFLNGSLQTVIVRRQFTQSSHIATSQPNLIQKSIALDRLKDSKKPSYHTG